LISDLKTRPLLSLVGILYPRKVTKSKMMKRTMRMKKMKKKDKMMKDFVDK
jgi:hypothetical protein